MISFYPGLKGVRLNLAELFEIEVKRVSVGSARMRTAIGAFHSAAREMRKHSAFMKLNQSENLMRVQAHCRYLS